MAKLSIIIPSRNEPYLSRTIQDVFDNARGEIEVVAHLDGYWPEDWQAVTDRYPNLHTVHSGEAVGMRAGINKAVASAKSRGAKYVMKLDAHCGLGEGFDEILKADIEDDWVVVPRRKRLDPATWTLTDTNKADVDYHYLSFPNDPNDFGGPGLNGKIWPQRAIERAQYEVDEELSSQGSAWMMSVDYFYRLELMDEANYGKFWNEFQECGLKSWLSGGRVMVNKKTWYSHWHKGKAGRSYKLPESWLKRGRDHTMKWIHNEAWDERQVRPFSWLIEHFWPVPTWPENWEELLYATRKPRVLLNGWLNSGSQIATASIDGDAKWVRFADPDEHDPVTQVVINRDNGVLLIHKAHYGVGGLDDIDVRQRIKQLITNNSLDIIINNSTLTPNQNPFRGQRKQLNMIYSFSGGDQVTIKREEKDWLIIGPVVQSQPKTYEETVLLSKPILYVPDGVNTLIPTTPAALNDYLIRKFSISPQRLRGPMPIELRDFHRNDLAQLFAELGFKRGAEIGVAEGNYSEVLLKANPECELLLVDPWHHYSDNPQGKSKEKHEFAYSETLRKTKDYPNVSVFPQLSMDAVRTVDDNSLDFCYVDAHHSYPYVMADIIEWTKKVRSGGIVALDDVYRLDEARWGAGPMEAIYDYTRAMRINPWWLIAAHKSVDAFFVKS